MKTSESDKKRTALLYVEDEAEPRELIGASMASEYPDLEVHLARDGAEGLELYREHRPDLVVTDILMPIMDGLHMAEKIKEIDPGTEIIALTAYSDTSFLLRAIEAGFSHYVLKPIDYDRLFAAIRQSLDVIELKRTVKEQNERIRSFATELEVKVEERTRELQESRSELARGNAKLREATGRLKAARDRYWSLYNWSPLGYLSLDDHFMIREINITGAHMLGARRSELRGVSIRERLSPQNVALLAEAIHRCMNENHALVDIQIRLQDDMLLYVQLHCFPYREEEEGRKLYRTALVDITRLKEAEAKLRESERLLIQQTRLAAMGELLNNISHHWRQPLNVLGLKLQQLSMMQRMAALTAEDIDRGVKESMDIIKAMSSMIDRFRSFSTPDKDKSTFRVSQVIQNALSLVEENFRSHGIALEIRMAEDSEIHGYPNEFTQVVLSLLMNAKDVLVERNIIPAQIAVQSWAEGGRSVVTVTDNAGGIDEAIMAKIFDAFYTTKPQGKGMGIGLFIAKTIVESEMGGQLTVRNAGDGAEFRMEV